MSGSEVGKDGKKFELKKKQTKALCRMILRSDTRVKPRLHDFTTDGLNDHHSELKIRDL